jgi:poly(A) polymerase
MLVSQGFSAYVWGFGAVESYLGGDSLPDIHVLTDADVSDLARIFEDLRFPGQDLAEAALDGKPSCYFRCLDSEEALLPAEIRSRHFPVDEGRRPSFAFLDFFQDWKSRRFFDPRGIYPLLRQARSGVLPALWAEGILPGLDRRRALMDGALILARYCSEEAVSRQISKMAELFSSLPDGLPPREEEQQLLLKGILASPNPGLGLELLKKGGFLAEFWPELSILDDVDHSKEFHPEGNAWKHTLETFRYRKTGDLLLSLGLLLHDIGKPLSESAGNHRFEAHAELGERQARLFLTRLNFEDTLIRDVCYLVRNHMLPAALPRLPLIRTGEIMSSPLFPTLLELYRCDESSSFKGLESYYESSAAYQSFLRYRRNPYRTADGRKLNRGQMSGAR